MQKVISMLMIIGTWISFSTVAWSADKKPSSMVLQVVKKERLEENRETYLKAKAKVAALTHQPSVTWYINHEDAAQQKRCYQDLVMNSSAGKALDMLVRELNAKTSFVTDVPVTATHVRKFYTDKSVSSLIGKLTGANARLKSLNAIIERELCRYTPAMRTIKVGKDRVSMDEQTFKVLEEIQAQNILLKTQANNVDAELWSKTEMFAQLEEQIRNTQFEEQLAQIRKQLKGALKGRAQTSIGRSPAIATAAQGSAAAAPKHQKQIND